MPTISADKTTWRYAVTFCGLIALLVAFGCGGVPVRTPGATTLPRPVPSASALVPTPDTSSLWYLLRGGGVYIDADAGSVLLQHNSIENNAAGPGAVSCGFGGGVYIVGDNATLEANLIQNNTAVGIIDPGDHALGGKGGGLYIFSGDPTLINNVVTGNSEGYGP